MKIVRFARKKSEIAVAFIGVVILTIIDYHLILIYDKTSPDKQDLELMILMMTIIIITIYGIIIIEVKNKELWKNL